MNYDKVKIRGVEYFRWRDWDSVSKTYVKVLYALKLKDLKIKVDKHRENRSKNIITSARTFADYMSAWLKLVHSVGKKQSTILRYQSTYRTHIEKEAIGNLKLKDLTADIVQSYYNDKSETASVDVVKSIHKILKPCLSYAAATGKIAQDFTKLLKIPAKPYIPGQSDKIHPLTLNQQMTFVQVIQGHEYEILYSTALDTGMRIGELAGLNLEDIDFFKEEINVNKSYNPDPRCGMTDTKNHKRRILPMPNITKLMLMDHLAKQKKQLAPLGITQTKDTPVFTNCVGGRIDRSRVLKQLKKIYAQMGITDKTMHDLRHTYATRLFELGENVKVVSVLLGHSSTAITLETYTTVLESLKEKAKSRIDELYTNLPNANLSVNPSVNFLKLVK